MNDNLNNEEQKIKNSNQIVQSIGIIILIVLVGFGSLYLLKIFATPESVDNNKLLNDETTTTEKTTTSSTTTSDYNPYKIDEHTESIKQEQHTVTFKGKEQTFNFIYQIYVNKALLKPYQYIVYVSSEGISYGEYSIGAGMTKDEAINASKDLKIDGSLIHTIKEDTAFGVEYLVFMIPVYQMYVENPCFVTHPRIYSETGKLLKTIDTSYDIDGYLIPKDPGLGFTKEDVESKYAAIRIKNNAIYYVEHVNCAKKENKGNIIKLTIQNQQIKEMIFIYGFDYIIEGNICNN